MVRWLADKLTYGHAVTTLVLLVGLGIVPPAAAATCKHANPPPPLAAVAQSRTYGVQITVPAQFDFTLASLTLSGSAIGSHVVATEPTGFDYVAAAALCQARRHIFVLVVNRLPRGSHAQSAESIALRVKTRDTELAPTIVQQVNVLANGAPGQDCSFIPSISADPPFTNYSGPRPLLGSELSPLFGETEKVARALDQACHVVWESTFERWVRQEPPAAVHP